MRGISITLPKWMVDEIDDRRGNTPRAKWIRQACQGRFDREDADEWSDPDIEDPTTEEVEA